MTDAERNSLFKAKVKGPAALLLPGIANALGARVAEDIGFEALYVTGAGVSNMTLGAPDLGLLTLDDVTEAVSRIRAVVELPLVVDADTGFGNAVNVYNTVRRLERAGASAIQIEDQVFPKKCGHFEGKAVIAAAEMSDKIKAAVDARRDENLQIIARTDARSTLGLDAAIERAHTFADAGADIIFVEAVTTIDEIRLLPQKIAQPQIINIVHGGKTPALDLETLEEYGFALVLYANAALQAALFGMQAVLSELHRSGSLEAVKTMLSPFDERQRVVRKAFYDDLEAKYTSRA